LPFDTTTTQSKCTVNELMFNGVSAAVVFD